MIVANKLGKELELLKVFALQTQQVNIQKQLD